MNPNREELLFQLALMKPAAERAEFLDRECGEDKALRARLESLLAAHEQSGGMLATRACRSKRHNPPCDSADRGTWCHD